VSDTDYTIAFDLYPLGDATFEAAVREAVRDMPNEDTGLDCCEVARARLRERHPTAGLSQTWSRSGPLGPGRILWTAWRDEGLKPKGIRSLYVPPEGTPLA